MSLIRHKNPFGIENYRFPKFEARTEHLSKRFAKSGLNKKPRILLIEELA